MLNDFIRCPHSTLNELSSGIQTSVFLARASLILRLFFSIQFCFLLDIHVLILDKNMQNFKTPLFYNKFMRLVLLSSC